MCNIYDQEFKTILMQQATNAQNRFKPVSHKRLNVGDVVMIKEPNVKPGNYPLALVIQVIVNEKDEVTGAIVRKGSTGKLLKRHVTTLVPLLECEPSLSSTIATDKSPPHTGRKNMRVASIRAKRLNSELMQEGLI